MNSERMTAAQVRALKARDEWDFSAVAALSKETQRQRAIDEYLRELGYPRGEAARDDYHKWASTMAVLREPVVRPPWMLAQMAPGAPSPNLGLSFLLAVNPEMIGTKKRARAVASAIARQLRTELARTAAGIAKTRRTLRRPDPFADPMARLWDLACHRLYSRFELGAKEAVVLLGQTAIAAKRPGQLNSNAGVLYVEARNRVAELLSTPAAVFSAERGMIFRELVAAINKARAQKASREK